MVHLKSDEAALVAQLKAAVAAQVQSDTGLQIFCQNEHTYVRYLRARNWNLQKATKMLQATLDWRQSYKPHLVRWPDVVEQARTGKQQIYETPDKEGRPVIVMRSRLENSKDAAHQIKFLIYHLEAACKLADSAGVGKMTWLVDFPGYSMSTAPPLKTSLSCLSILQDHYPERLGLALCYHAPMFFSMSWKAISPFVDPVTKGKILFVDAGVKNERELMEKIFHMDKIETVVGGSMEVKWDLDAYSTRMAILDANNEAEFAAAAGGGKLSGGGAKFGPHVDVPAAADVRVVA